MQLLNNTEITSAIVFKMKNKINYSTVKLILFDLNAVIKSL